jgi:hypothetical protein
MEVDRFQERLPTGKGSGSIIIRFIEKYKGKAGFDICVVRPEGGQGEVATSHALHRACQCARERRGETAKHVLGVMNIH